MRPHVLTRQRRKEGPGTPARRGLNKAKAVTTQSRTRKLVKKLAKSAVAGKSATVKTPKKVTNLNLTVKNASKTAAPRASQKPTETVKATSPERKKEPKRSETKSTSPEKKVVPKQSDGKVATAEKKKDVSDIRKSTSLDRKKEPETKKTKTTTPTVVKKITVTKSENLKDGSDQTLTERKIKKNPLKLVKVNTNKADSKTPDHMAGSKTSHKNKFKENPVVENRLKDASAEASTTEKSSEVQQTNLPKSTGDKPDAKYQSKTNKDRARSPQKRKRLCPIRSSSAPIPTSESTKIGTDEDQSKIGSVARASKLSSENIVQHNNPKKTGPTKKGSKSLDTSKCNKTKDIDPTIAKPTDDHSPIKEPSNIQTVNPSVWPDNQKCTMNDKESGILIKMPFLDSQLVAPLGRKKLIGKVKPIARVKGTVIESKKPDMEKKVTTDCIETLNAGESILTIPEAETSDKLKNDSDKKKCTAVPSKPVEDSKKSIDPSKALKCLKKLEVGKPKESVCGKSVIPENPLISEDQTSQKIMPKLKSKNPAKSMKRRPKISLLKGRPIVKKTKKLPTVKGVKLAKKLLKVSQSVDKKVKSIKDSASSSDEVTYSFPESVIEPNETGNSDKTPSLESKSAILKKPKLVKSLPKKIQLVKSSKKPYKALNKSNKSAGPCPSEIKVFSENTDLKTIEVLEKMDDLILIPDSKYEDENIAKINITEDTPAPQPSITTGPLESVAEVVTTIPATDTTVNVSLTECPILPVQDIATVVSNKSIPEKIVESYPSTDDNSENEERFAFPKIKKEIKGKSVTSPSPGQKKKFFKSSPKPVKKFISIPTDDTKRRMRLLGFWTGPKKHREASLNAQAKVQCLYENESRTHLELGLMRTIDRVPPKWKDVVKKKPIKTEKRNSTSSESEYEKKVKSENTSSEDESNAPTRTLRYQPTGSGKYWEMKLSSSEESEAEHRRQAPEKKKYTIKPKVVVKSEKTTDSSDMVKVKKPKPSPPPKKKRVRAEVVMDLRDMVVKKRMASLNATAMLHASYEKRSPKSSKEGTTSDSQTSSEEERLAKKSRSYLADRTECSTSRKDFTSGVTEVTAATKKMAVIVNQEADVTITGVYSTHTGYCTVSEMQYRISATSHTQTTATAATAATEKEVVLGPPVAGGSGPGYTPLGALSSMHPPLGVQPHMHPGPGPSMESRGPLGGALGRRAGCSSAFSAPPHHHPDTDRTGYYQPAGPLISAGPLHGGFKGADGAASGAPPPPQDPAYSRYQYPQPQQVMHYGGGYGAPHPHPSYYGGPGRLGAMGAPAAPPPPTCYRAPPAHRPPPNYRPPPPPPDNQGSPAGGEAYAPQYCAPCYQHPHVPPRPPITYLDSAYQGCPCPMQSCPKNVHTGPVTGNPPTSGGPGKTSERGQGGGGTGRGCSVLAGGQLPPEALGPPSPARGSAGLDPPHPPRRARLGKAMARKSIAPGDTSAMLLMCRPGPCTPTPPPPPPHHSHPAPHDQVKSEQDSGDEVILLDSPGAKMAPIDLSSSEDNCADNKSEKDCVILRSEENDEIIDLSLETKKENTDTADVPPMRLKNTSNTAPEVQALKEHNTDVSIISCENLKKSSDVKPKTGTKRRCSKLEIDMEVDMDDSLAANGIGEHVKLQKRQKVSLTSQLAKKHSMVRSYKDLIKKNEKVFKLNNGKRQLNTIKTEKKSPGKGMTLMDSDKSLPKRLPNKRKSTSPSVRESPVNKRKRFGSSLLKLADKRMMRVTEDVPEIEKPRETCKKSIIASVPKSKSVILLDDLIMKNNIDRVIESVVKNAPVVPVTSSEPSPAVLFSPTTRSPAKSPTTSTSTLKPKKGHADVEDTAAVTPKSRTVLNINNNVVKKSSESEISVPLPKAERKLSTDKRGRTKSKSPAAIHRILEKKQKEPVKAKIAESEMKEPLQQTKAESAKTKKASKVVGKGLGKRKGKSSEGMEIAEIGQFVEGFRDMPLLRRGPQGPRWSNGWTWEGEPQLSKVYINNEESFILARSWAGMRHAGAGDTVRRGDSVLLRAGARRSEPPFVARVSQLWENPTDGEMMVSLLWYYRPEHTERGRQPEDCSDEVFASRHRDVNSVACIEDKCYVLTYNEYCRYRKQLRATEENVRLPPSIVPAVPPSEVLPALACNDSRLPPGVAPDLVLFCRRVYDFRLKKVISVTGVKGKAYYN